VESPGEGKRRTGTFSELFDITDGDPAVLEGRSDEADSSSTSGVLDLKQMVLAYERHRTSAEAPAVEPLAPSTRPPRLGTVLPPMSEPERRGLSTGAVIAISVALILATAGATIAVMVALGFRPGLVGESAAAEGVAVGEADAGVAPAPAYPGLDLAATAAELEIGIDAGVADEPAAEAVAELAAEPPPAPVAARKTAAIAEPARPQALAKANVDDDDGATRKRRDRRAERRDSVAAAEPPPIEVEPEPEAPVEAAAPSSSAAAPALGGSPASRPTAAANACDAVMCLVDPNAACCKKQDSDEVDAPTEPVESLPTKLSSREVNAGISPIRGRLLSCGDRHGFSGTARLRLVIKANGRVDRAAVATGSPEFRECLVGVAAKARFARTQRGLTVYYPVVFR